MTETVAACLYNFRLANGLHPNEENRKIWLAQLGIFVMPLPNFLWRRTLINRHDAHHLLTEYSTSPSGELSLAAWELGAKCFEGWQANFLCRMLIFFGYISQPRLTQQAYRKGCSQAGSYKVLMRNNFLEMPISKARLILNNDAAWTEEI